MRQTFLDTYESTSFKFFDEGNLEMQFKMKLTFVPSLDKIKIVPVKYVEQIDAHNINIYVLVSVVRIHNCCISETCINLMWKNIS
jgi:hypothetical protein